VIGRRSVLRGGVSAGLAVFAGRSKAAEHEMFYWDNHAGFDFHGPQDIDLLDRWRAAGIGYLSVNVGYDPVPWTSTVRAIADYTRQIESRSDMALCSTLAEIRRARRAGKMALTFDIEGMGSLNGDLSMVEFYYKAGVRQMLIAYNLNNDAGGGCHDDDKGLTDFGRAVILEMNRVGMTVDCAHSGIRSGLEAMKLSKKPCIFSHANARALHEHQRNITDEQIKACAATGGVIGVNGVAPYLGDGPGSPEAMVAHIDYMVKLVGADHVGIGLDYDCGLDSIPDKETSDRYWPPALYPNSANLEILAPDAFPAIERLLRAKGYREKDVRAIMGGNFQRIASQVWAI